MATTIEEILAKAHQQNIMNLKNKEALDWLSKETRKLTLNPTQFMREDGHRLVGKNNLGIGKMYLFFYDPKWKQELPYYDRFPCIYVLHRYLKERRFLGLNLHYLDYRSRAILMDALLKFENNARIPENKKLAISYGILKGFAKFNHVKPCIKMYLNDHTRSRFIWVNHQDWPIVSMLPVHQFEKKSASHVWKESRKSFS